jgi:hypothetical protein
MPEPFARQVCAGAAVAGTSVVVVPNAVAVAHTSGARQHVRAAAKTPRRGRRSQSGHVCDCVVTLRLVQLPSTLLRGWRRNE